MCERFDEFMGLIKDVNSKVNQFENRYRLKLCRINKEQGISVEEKETKKNDLDKVVSPEVIQQTKQLVETLNQMIDKVGFEHIKIPKPEDLDYFNRKE